MFARVKSSFTVGVALAIVAAAQAQTVSRVSVSGAGAEADSSSSAVTLSFDGNFEAFASSASNLSGSDTNGAADIFVRDRRTGAITRASVSSTGVPGNYGSANPVLNADGSIVAFESDAYNLVPMDANGGKDIFIYELTTGTTTRVSIPSTGGESLGNSFNPSISGDGRFIAFDATAHHDPGDANGYQDVYVHDRSSGTTLRASLGPAGVEANELSGSCKISNDGLWIAFHTRATNLFANDVNQRQDVVVRDMLAGVNYPCSISSVGQQGNNDSSTPSISGDGRYIAFQSAATNLVSDDTNGQADVFVFDRIASTIERVSLSTAGAEGNGFSGRPAISGDGRFVAFQSSATNLVPGDVNGFSDVFVRDRAAGTTSRVSVALGCAFADGANNTPNISGDGSVIVFQSFATNLVPGDTNGVADDFENASGSIGIYFVIPPTGSESGGDYIKIGGIGLAGAGSTTVTIGGHNAPVLDATPTFVRCIAPPGTGVADVVLTGPNGCITSPTNYTYVAPFLAARFGNVNMAFNDRFDVLFVNGSPGDAQRELTIARTDPLTMTMMIPPLNSVSGRFVLYAWIGVPDATTLTPHPGIGPVVFPTPVTGGIPQPVRIWNNLGFRARLGSPSYPSSPAPSTILRRPRGAGQAATATFQGFIQDDGSTISQHLSITNAVVLHVL
jgi:Tol biopolymer transport system component